eukprot:scaffold28684_cov44-Phaeocystis_antarctica.AAC.2
MARRTPARHWCRRARAAGATLSTAATSRGSPSSSGPAATARGSGPSAPASAACGPTSRWRCHPSWGCG